MEEIFHVPYSPDVKRGQMLEMHHLFYLQRLLACFLGVLERGMFVEIVYKRWVSYNVYRPTDFIKNRLKNTQQWPF